MKEGLRMGKSAGGGREGWRVRQVINDDKAKLLLAHIMFWKFESLCWLYSRNRDWLICCWPGFLEALAFGALLYGCFTTHLRDAMDLSH